MTGFVRLFLFLALAMVSAAGELYPAYIDVPETLVDGHTLQFGVRPRVPEHRVVISRVTACGSSTHPFIDYNYKDVTNTGCQSSGFMARDIFKEKHRIESPFGARLSPQGLLIRRVLINPRSSTVNLEIHVRVYTLQGQLVAGPGQAGEWVLTTSYAAPDRLNLGTAVETKDVPSGELDRIVEGVPNYVFVAGFVALFVLMIGGMMVYRTRRRIVRAENPQHASEFQKQMSGWMRTAAEKNLYNGRPTKEYVV